MNARERTKAALTFNAPDRAPRDIWTLTGVSVGRQKEYEDLIGQYPTDIGGASAVYEPTDRGVLAYPLTGTYLDHWGSMWHVGEPGVIGEVKLPAIEDWTKLDTFQPPWCRIRKRDFSAANQTCEQSALFILSEWTANPFERLQFLRGTENVFMDIAWGDEKLKRLLTMVHEYNLEDISGWCGTNVDGIVFSDDWGSNRALLINPDTWREMFKPLYQEYVKLIHAAGKFAFFHSDGNIQSIFNDLVEIGIDAINSQLFVMNIEELGRRYKGKITFWGELDRQRILPFGTPNDVRDAVRRVRRALDNKNGGVIALLEWGKKDPAENIATAYRTWMEDQ